MNSEEQLVISLKAKCFDLIEENRSLNNLINQVAQNLNVSTAEDLIKATKPKAMGSSLKLCTVTSEERAFRISSLRFSRLVSMVFGNILTTANTFAIITTP